MALPEIKREALHLAGTVIRLLSWWYALCCQRPAGAADRAGSGGPAGWRTGVAPDIRTSADQAQDTAYDLALQDVLAAGGAAAAEARGALAAFQADTA